MTSARLFALLRAVRALGGSRTAYALLGLYAIVCGMLWLVSHGFIAPDGSIDLRIWINGHIVDLPKLQAWWLGGGGAALVAGYGLYGRAVATGPLFQLAQAVMPEVAAVVQAMAGETPAAPQAAAERPAPVVIKPVGLAQAATLGQTPLGIVTTVGGGE